MTVQTIRDDDLISRNVSVVGADAADEAILIDIDSGYFFQLNKSAARIWTLVEQPRSFADVCAALQAKFAIPPETCRSDVADFVADMQDRGLLTIGNT